VTESPNLRVRWTCDISTCISMHKYKGTKVFVYIYVHNLYMKGFSSAMFRELCYTNKDPNNLVNLVTYCKEVSNSCFSWWDLI
jgi:hypothetical protein